MTTNTYVAYNQINSLEEFSFIAGTDYTLTFNVYEEDGVTPQNIGGASVKWVLSPYGQSYNALQIDADLLDDYSFEVVIPAASTANLSGKYIHQPVITSFYDEEFRPAQGVVLILPQTPLS